MKTLPKIDKCPCGSTARLHYRDEEDTRLHFYEDTESEVIE